jgi:hypothetical protein
MCRASRAVHTNCQTMNDGKVKERRILNERTMGVEQIRSPVERQN